MSLYLLALITGIAAGLRTFVPAAAVCWAIRLGLLASPASTPLGFLGFAASPYVFTALAAGELVTDKLPKTPSRKALVPFGGRLITGAVCGAAIGRGGNVLVAGLVIGVVGAIIGTLGGSALRGRMAKAFGKDLPAALIEDVIAVGGTALAFWALV